MQGNREGRLSLRLEPTLNVGKREGGAKTFPTFTFSTKCRELGNAG